MDRYEPFTFESGMLEHHTGYWVKYDDAMAEVAELKANLHETIELLHGSQADAIREMAMKLGNGDDNYWFTVAAINKYADKLEKGE